MDSAFQEADEAFKGAERRPTAQKGGAHAPPKITKHPPIVCTIITTYNNEKSVCTLLRTGKKYF